MTAAATVTALVLGLAQAPASAEPRPTPFSPPKVDPVSSVPVTELRGGTPAKRPALPDATRKPAPEWPEAGAATVDLPPPDADARAATKAARAGELPVSVAPARAGVGRSGARAAADAPAKVRVRVYDRAATAEARVRGLLLRLDRADARTAEATVDVAVDYAAFRTAYGADWASRLRLVALPECALSTPERRECRGEPLASRNDPRKGTVTAAVPLVAAPAGSAAGAPVSTLLAVAAGVSGPAGDFSATSLQPSSTWAAGGSSGDFTWSYPMRVPPAPGGPAPGVGLSYSAQSVDGRHAASNNQPSWIGEGFETSAGGFIERRYEGCAEDRQGDANNDTKTGDLCWATDNATLSLSGHSGELIYNASEGRWHLRGDDGSRVERRTGASNGDHNGEYWVVTTTDGTQYWFGAHRLPGWTTGKPVTNSVWTVPVFGNHPGEPCHASAFEDSSCDRAWRWNLDYVVDAHGNSASYWYGKETNRYARNLDNDDVVDYTRGGYLDRIDYATRRDGGADSVFTTNAPARIDFGVADRCLSSCGTHDEAHWPDTPWDQECTGATCENYSPTFWSTKRLSSVTTQIRSGSSYSNVERWTLTHTFPDPGDGTRAGLWLSKLSHTGLVGTAVSMPDVEFTGIQLSNRVDTIDFAAAMNWWRISQIRSETGGTISVLYSDEECAARTKVPTEPASNTLRCYPVRWTPEGYADPVVDYFHKYVVTTVYEADNTGGVVPNGSPRVAYRYSYLTPPAWHYADDDGLIEKKEKTWAVWRGYGKVGVTVGDTGEQAYSETVYFRGMHGDRAATGTRTVTLAGTGVPTVNDEDAYAGMTRETITFNGPGGAVVSRQVFEPWQSGPTASRTINGDTVQARRTGTLATHERTALDGGRGTRVRSIRNTFDAHGMVVAVDDAGDTATTGDESCTRTTREPRNTGAWLLAVEHRTVVSATTCAAATDLTGLTGDDVVADSRVSYDGQAYGATPTRGLATRREEAHTWNSGSPSYDVVSRAEYDSHGRVTSAWDALDNVTTTAYTPTTGGLVTKTVVTNALGHTATTTFDTAYGLATSIVDANDKRTDLAYDGLGRLTSVWLPGRVKGTDSANTTYAYLIRNAAPSVVTTRSLNAAGNYLTSHSFFDGLLRSRQTQQPSPAGGRVITDVFYDTAGRKVREHGGYYNVDPPSTTLTTATDRQDVPNQARTVYDGAGRVIACVFQPYATERWRTSTVYGGDRVDVTPPAGATPTSTVSDALGRTTSLRQYHGAGPAGAHDAASYAYDRKGRLDTITDSSGNVWAYDYDLRGRLTSTSDPDRGSTVNTYDAGGRLTTTTDARGIKLTYGYDALNRRTAILQTGVGTRARWVYDTVAKGYLTQSIRFVGTANYTRRIYAYDDAYRPTSQAVIIPSVETGLAGTYSSATYYNVDGSPSGESYPEATDLATEHVSYHYDPTTGLPTHSSSGYNGSAVSYVSRADYDALGRLSQLVSYTGLYSGLGARVYQAFTHELETGRLIGMRTDRESVSPYTVANAELGYDPAGNITKIADSAAGDTQCFQYDHLRRLTQAWTPGSADCAAAPASQGVGGPAPYWQSWTYDKAGNRLTEVQHATPGGGTQRSTTYTYPAPGSPRPHAVTSTATTAGGSTVTAGYTYDDAGNTLTRPAAGAGTQTMTWDPEGRLATSTDATGTTTYIYDADGNRLVARDPTGKTLYLPGQEVRYTAATGATTCTRYYSFNGITVASRTAAGLSWLSADHQGTAGIAVNAATQQATMRRQTPFGSPRGAAPETWPNTRGFVGGTVDKTGLTHLGAREYDPSAGRFVSVDPIMDPADPQQWNGYAYANNNPITFSDPTGMLFSGLGDLFDALLDELKGGVGEAAGKGHPRNPDRGGGSRYDSNRDGKITAGDWAVGAAGCRHRYGFTSGAPHCAGREGIRQAGDFVGDVSGFNDYARCMQGDAAACGWAFAGVAVGGAIGIVGMVLFKGVKGLWRFLRALPEPPGKKTPVTPGGKGAPRDGGDGPGGSGPRGCKSFSGGTRVLMADGSTKPISKVKPGDKVMATDPKSGKSGPRTVTHVWVHDDQLVDLVVDGEAVTTTEDHPFWNETDREWERADELGPNDSLRGADGSVSRTLGLRLGPAGPAPAFNLTVDGIHTYYVLAGTTPVLVHNDGGGRGPWGNAQLWRGGDFPIGGADDVVGPSNGILYRTNPDGAITNYAVYDADGVIQYRVDLVGDAHGGVETPHTQYYVQNRNPKTGAVYPKPRGDAVPGVGPEGEPPFGC